MKKLSAILSLVLIVSLLAGCAGTPVIYHADCTCPTNDGAVQPPATEATPQPTEVPATGALKTGLVISTSVKDSKSATAEEAGEGKYDVTIVAVLVDDNGVIQDCIIDGIATSVKFDAAGTITTDLTAAPLTKNELGENYGMVAWGGAIAEWDEQAAALANFAIGKTVEELKAGAVDETGKAPAGSDLASSATIYLGGYVYAIEAAVNNAQHLGAQSGDELKLAVVSTLGNSKNADGENAGEAQLYTNVSAITMKDEIITSCVIDAVQAKVGFDATGAITSDVTAPVQTKNELGENYGMVAWGGAIAEWNVQAASFASYVTGKTAADVAGIAVDETTKPTDADLATSVTIKIGDFQALIAKAAATDVTASALKTGLYIATNTSKSKDVNGEVEGLAQYDVTIIAVLVDDNGVIVDCVIDGITASVEFNGEGQLVTDLATDILTKNELGEDYNMKAWGGAIAEWDEQAAAFADYITGMTVEEVKGIAIDESTKPTDADLTSSVTIAIGGFIPAVEAAVNNAQHLGAQSGDELKLAVISTIGNSKSADGENAGEAQLYTNVSAITMKDEIITSCVIDAVQAKIGFDATGTITSDVTAPVQTKNELGENYGMVEWGGAIAEWNVQAASFAAYVTGKTAAEVAGIAVDENTKPTDADLATSVTIKIGDFQALIAKAAQ